MTHDSSSQTVPSASREMASRSLAKAVSWRVLGTLDTFILSFVVIKYLGPFLGFSTTLGTGDVAIVASSIAIAEVITKIVLYTLHERFWANLHWGVSHKDEKRQESHWRSLLKTGLWRVVASVDTTILAWVFTGNITTALSVGTMEVFTKILLYYFHERAWQRIHYGIKPSLPAK